MYLAVGGRRNTSPASLSNAKYSKATELFIWYSQRPREPFFADRMTAPSSIVLLSMSSERGSVLDWSNISLIKVPAFHPADSSYGSGSSSPLVFFNTGGSFTDVTVMVITVKLP